MHDSTAGIQEGSRLAMPGPWPASVTILTLLGMAYCVCIMVVLQQLGSTPHAPHILPSPAYLKGVEPRDTLHDGNLDRRQCWCLLLSAFHRTVSA
jgi:hypothetical protein